MKNNSWVKNSIYLILIVFLFWIGTVLLANHLEEAEITYRNNITFIILINFIFFGGIGIVLGLDNLIIQLKKKGKIKVNIPRLIVLGVPSLIMLNPFIWINLIPSALPFLNSILLISSLILGYTIVSSLIKE